MAIFLPALLAGGASLATVRIAEGLAGRGLRTDLLLTKAEGYYLGSVPEDVRVIDFGAWHTVTSLPRLLGYLRRERPDVLIAVLRSSIAVALIAKRFFAPGVATVALQQTELSGEFGDGGFASRMLMRVMERLLPSADAVVAVSHAVADDLRRRAPAASRLVRTIRNPVVGPELAGKAAEPVEHRWFGDPETPTILSVGRLDIQKDYFTLLRAFTALSESRPARLLILGEGPDRDRLTALARRLGIAERVDMPGFVSNPLACMARAQVFVLSSRFEGLPTVLIEAMACGVPVVSTDCAGAGEILEGGKWGRLSPVGDPRALARTIAETLDNPLAPEVLVARAGAFSRETAIDRYMDLVDALRAPCN